MLKTILDNVAEAGYSVAIDPEIKAQLQAICLTDLSNGGRGVRNQLEAHLVNPLARALFEFEGTTGCFLVMGLERGATTTLSLVSTA